MFRRSLRNKLVGVFLLPTLATILVYGLLAYFAAHQGLEEELGKRVVAVGQAVSADMSESIDAAQIERLDASMSRVQARLQERLVRVRNATGVRRVFIFDREHKSLVDTDGQVAFGQQIYQLDADRVEIERTFAAAEATTSTLFASEDGQLHKTGYAPLTNEGRVVAVLAVEASAEYFDLLTNFASVLSILGALGLALVIVAATLFSRALIRPVNDLVEAAKRLGRGEWEQPVLADGLGAEQGDEIDYLAYAFEEMRRDIVQRDRQLQMMLSGIAHEVRNPLGGMELFCGLLREDLEAADDEGDHARQIEMVRKIQRELGYLEKVVRDFLDFARSHPLERERFSATELLEEVSALMSGELDEACCPLVCNVVSDALEISADRERLRRAIINLVRNAYQACPNGGHITLSVSGHDSERIISIGDDGPGIEAARLEEICQPFYTTKEKGSGLGLALTRQIVEQHGGRLEIESTVGVGTTMRIILPFDPSVEARTTIEAAAIPHGWLG
ncbi:MAG: HAMP domain-containing histidine kinase [Bradymonadaceae bacterium]|nr:HAMP domain-containing histidine kinase [Lujinxingiaceae bacterium]